MVMIRSFQQWHCSSLNHDNAGGCLLQRLVICMMALFIPVLLMVSCQGKETDSTKNTDENWAELFFEERLSSISTDPDTSCFYIGTEDGALFVYNEDGIKKYNTPFDRIYCVKRDMDKQDYYWVGTRNMGLFYCHLEDDRLVKLQSYTIPVKEDRFSVYDICIDKDTLYLGTSHGLFAVSSQVPQSTGSSINLEQRWHKNTTDASPVVVGKLCPDNDGLYFTTSVGIYKYSNGLSESVIPQPDTVMLAALSKGQDGKIRAIIDNKLYTIDGSQVDSVSVAHRSIDFVNLPKYLYRVSRDSLYVTSRNDGINTARALPSPARVECRNIICDDVAHDQVLLVTSHHLLRIPHHYSLPTSKYIRVGVSASCTDGPKAYFLCANKVFQWDSGDTVAHEKCHLNASHHPSRITVCDGKLYYVADKKLYCKNLDNGDEEFWVLNNEPTALGSHKGNVYIGVRDSLLLLKDGTLRSDPIKLMKRVKGAEGAVVAQFPFITAFCNAGDSLLIATLNDGVYIGENDVFNEKFSGDSLRFIRDIAVHGNNTFILTHRGLWRHSSDTQAASPHQYIDSKGFNRLLVNNQSVTMIADFGLREFRINGDVVDGHYRDYYQDWSFRPELSFIKDSVMVISRNNGVLMFNKPLSESSEVQWLEFIPSWRPSDDLILVLMCAAVALALLLLVWWLMRRSHSQEIQAKDELIQTKVEELQAKDEELRIKEKKYKVQTDELRGKMESLNSQIKELNSQVEEFECQIQAKEEEIQAKEREFQGQTEELMGQTEELKRQKNELINHVEALKSNILTKEKEYQLQSEGLQHQQKILDLLSILRNQVEEVRSYGLSSYKKIKQQAFEVAESNDVNRIQELSSTIKGILDDVATVKSWQQTWEKGESSLYLPIELNNRRNQVIKLIKAKSLERPTECVDKIDDFMNYCISDDVVESVKKHIGSQLTAVKETVESVPVACESHITGILTAQQDAYQQLLERLESSTDSISEDEIVDLLKEVKTLDERHNMAKGVVDLERAICSAQPKSLSKKVTDRDNSLFSLIEDFKSSNSSLRTDLKKSLADLAENAEDAIKAIYAPWIQGLEVDKELLELVKTSSTTGRLYKSDGSLSVRGVMMALLISGVKLSTSETKILLDSITYERDGDYKKEKSEAKTHLEEVETQAQLQQYAIAQPSSIAQIFCNMMSESPD